MSRQKRLVLFVEGDGDFESVPVLVKRCVTELGAWSHVMLDTKPIITRGLGALTKGNYEKWKRWLGDAWERDPGGFGGVLLVLDGDTKYGPLSTTTNRTPFCAKDAAELLAKAACGARAGELYSVAVVFARQEFESWLLAGIESLRGLSHTSSRLVVRDDAAIPDDHDTDASPRNAKKWLSERMEFGYREAEHQKELTKLVSLDAIRKRNPRSFRRFESAVKQLCDAFRDGRHIVSPAPR